MSSSRKPESIAAALDRTAHLQRRAADPKASVWVSANAGTGKTHVLTMRVLRLLLAGTAPQRILCLTYTKAAAAEMSKRVFDELGAWVIAPDDFLAATLEGYLSHAPTATEIALARTLFTAAIETPGGFQVQTIHAFAERLLQRFPLEAGVTPGFTILDEEMGRRLLREAADQVLGLAARESSSELGRALTTAVAYAADNRFDDILAEALRCRKWLEGLDIAVTERQLRDDFAIPEGATCEQIQHAMANVCTDALLAALRDILAQGSANDARLAVHFGAAAASKSAARRAEALRPAFLTGEGVPRKAVMTKPMAMKYPSENELADKAKRRYAELEEIHCGLKLIAATMALARLAAAIGQRYTDAKVRRAALDFDDLIEKSRELLLARGSAEWVLFKLDSGIDHILVDESQDTSPSQWDVVAALAAEFFSGRGARDAGRTLFAVGDEKQSIYSFQGAAPQMFGAMGDKFGEMAGHAASAFAPISLDVSFRSVEPVLAAVDAVFASPQRTAGVGVSALRHVAQRAGHAGSVEIWQTEKHADVPAADAWSPFEEESAALPVTRLANRIADTIQGWLKNGELLASEDRPITPGDILILVRKREPFAAPMVAALKARQIPVAGADRIRLADQIAVQDLLSLGDFLTLPEDDLALAEVLKSPIFNLDDDDLLKIAPGRKGTLWKALLDAAASDPKLAAAAATLKRWRKGADFAPPYEFFARILDGDGVRQKLLARLGPDAADPIDEFQNLALVYDDRAPPSLSGFLHWLREENREIKRDMEHGRNQVRVMTVHGAKGLEAPIVFLPDTCGSAAGQRGGMPIKVKGRDGTESFLWPVKGTGGLAPVRAAKAAIDREEREERNRLLYVAMTRARDRLYIAGFEGKKAPESDCWHNIISAGLQGMLDEAEDSDGRPVLRLAAPQTISPKSPKRGPAGATPAAPLPAWAKTQAPREAQLAVPLAPSRLAPYETDDTGEPSPEPRPRDSLAEPPAAPPREVYGDSKFLRGTLTHALLQYLPGLEPKAWPQAARGFIDMRGPGLPDATKASIVSETLRILEDKTFAPLFGAASRAEVGIAAVIPRPKGSGPALKIGGQIDRLAFAGDQVLIIDYKTNRRAPATLEGVAEVYLYQLAAYRLAVAEIYKDKPVRAALLWTEGPKIMEIPAEVLDTYASRLWELDQGRLDA